MRCMNKPITAGSDKPEWLELIHTVNARAANRESRIFGKVLDTGPWWAGGSVEEYEHARVIHRDDDTVSVEGKTDAASTAIAEAAASLGIVG